MKVQRVKVAEHQYVWLVLDDNFLPVQPIEVFIRYLHHTEKSPDTIQSYAAHLKLFWEYLQISQKNWQQISIADFTEFVHWLGPRVRKLRPSAALFLSSRNILNFHKLCYPRPTITRRKGKKCAA